MYQLASAVAALHENGFIHEDLHSGNVMVSDVDKSEPERVNICVVSQMI